MIFLVIVHLIHDIFIFLNWASFCGYFLTNEGNCVVFHPMFSRRGTELLVFLECHLFSRESNSS